MPPRSRARDVCERARGEPGVQARSTGARAQRRACAANAGAASAPQRPEEKALEDDADELLYYSHHVYQVYEAGTKQPVYVANRRERQATNPSPPTCFWWL